MRSPPTIYFICIFIVPSFGLIRSNDQILQEEQIGTGMRRQGARNLIAQYLQNHSVGALMVQDTHTFCESSFVLAKVWCDQRIGNGLGILLNGLATAVVTDRPLVVKGTCNDHLNIVPGRFLTQTQFQDLQRQHGCKHDAIMKMEANSRYSGFRCCDFDSSARRVMEVVYTQPFASQSLQNARLDKATLARANELFGGGDDDWSAWGELMRAAVAWNPSSNVLSSVQEQMTDIIHTLKVGIHVRHQYLDKEHMHMMDARTTKCLAKMMEKFQGKHCTLIVASDRPDTISAINSTFDQRFDDLAYLEESLPQCQVKRTFVANKTLNINVNYGEHGPFSNVDGSMSDLYSLSRADALLGTFGSTFSNLAAFLMVESQPKAAANIYRSDTCELWKPIMGKPGDIERFKADRASRRRQPSEPPLSEWPACAQDSQERCWQTARM